MYHHISSKFLLPCYLGRDVPKMEETKGCRCKTGRARKEKSKVATYCAVVLHLPPYSETRERGVKASKETERKRWRKSRLFVSAPLVARGHGAKQKVCFAINGLSALLEPIDLHAAKERYTHTYRQQHH